ncbi:MAG: RluA family pseudouridine synthase [Clostridia bacterium]|nr:RluA family pseudouridine synthase [Clostridia bacterium]
MLLTHTVEMHEANQKISQLLKNKFNISSRLLTKLKMNQKIIVNGQAVFSSYILHEKDQICVKIDFQEEDFIAAENIKLNILYEDEYLLAVSKPAGMVVHPSSYHLNNTLANGVKYYLNNSKKIRPVNRLDRDTSGIVVFAKNEYIQELMKNDGSMQKEYLTIVTGLLANKKDTINKPIARKEGSIMERIVDATGQDAITHYNVLDESVENNLSLVHVVLETGRTHQIRVHFAYLGNSILGDTLYGTETNLINRQSLHAWKLSFSHPITKEKITILADIPNDMKNVMKLANLNKF